MSGVEMELAIRSMLSRCVDPSEGRGGSDENSAATATGANGGGVGGAARSGLASSLISSDSSGERLFAWNSRDSSICCLALTSLVMSSPASSLSVVDEERPGGGSIQEGSGRTRGFQEWPTGIPQGTAVRQLLANSSGERVAVVMEQSLAIVHVPASVSAASASSFSADCLWISTDSCSSNSSSSTRRDVPSPAASPSAAAAPSAGAAVKGVPVPYSSPACRILQASWHPVSPQHLAVLSSDSAFRLYRILPGSFLLEQEYFLQPGSVHGGSLHCSAFAFGGDRGWERFAVFFLYFDGSIYCLCPIVAFSSWLPSRTLLDLRRDCQEALLMWQHESAPAVHAGQARHWLDSVFNERDRGEPGQQKKTNKLMSSPGSMEMIQAEPFAFQESSIRLQGPFQNLSCATGSREEDGGGVVRRGGERGAGRGVRGERGGISKAYHSSIATLLIGDCSLIATSSTDGFVSCALIGGDVHPAWDNGLLPKQACLVTATAGDLPFVSMVVHAEQASSVRKFADMARGGGALEDFSASPDDGQSENWNQKQSFDSGTGESWTSSAPPLVPFAQIDLSLPPHLAAAAPLILLSPPSTLSSSSLSDFLLCHHAAGIDALFFHLPLPSNSLSVSPASKNSLPPVKVFSLWDVRRPPRAGKTLAPGSFVDDSLLSTVFGAALISDGEGRTKFVAMNEHGEVMVGGVDGRQWGMEGEEEEEGGRSSSDGEEQRRGWGVSAEVLQGPVAAEAAPTSAALSSCSAAAAVSDLKRRAELLQLISYLQRRYLQYCHRAHAELIAHTTRLSALLPNQQQLQDRVDALVQQESAMCRALLTRAKKLLAANEGLKERSQELNLRLWKNNLPLSKAEERYVCEIDEMEALTVPGLKSSAAAVAQDVESALLNETTISAKGQSTSPYSKVKGRKEDEEKLMQAMTRLMQMMDVLKLHVEAIDLEVSQRTS